MISNNLSKLISVFRTLPGIGYNMAMNISLHLVQKSYKEVEFFVNTIMDSKKNLYFCKICGNISDSDTCNICLDDNRDKNIICVVEDISDIMVIEKTREYKGLFHVLGGHISPLYSTDRINVKTLLSRIEDTIPKEIIIATNSTVEGEATALYLYNILSKFNIRITRIAKGIPVGLNLEYIDPLTVAKSIENRIDFFTKR